MKKVILTSILVVFSIFVEAQTKIDTLTNIAKKYLIANNKDIEFVEFSGFSIESVSDYDIAKVEINILKGLVSSYRIKYNMNKIDQTKYEKEIINLKKSHDRKQLKLVKKKLVKSQALSEKAYNKAYNFELKISDILDKHSGIFKNGYSKLKVYADYKIKNSTDHITAFKYYYFDPYNNLIRIRNFVK